MEHQPFKADAQGKVDYQVDVFPITVPGANTLMVIAAEEGAIYITKAQAMAFFNLVPKE